MTRIRIGDITWDLQDAEWPHWVRSGRVPPEALVWSVQWTRGVWREAAGLETYHLYLPSRVVETPLFDAAIARHGPLALFRGSELAVTEWLLLINLFVTAALVFVWRATYADRIWELAAGLRAALLSGWIPVLFGPLFLHASATHLLSNMVTLLFAGALVEEFYGRKRTFLIYLGAGIGGALLSFTRERPVLAIGASGAIFGLYGAILILLWKHRDRFGRWLRWKTRRVYLPMLALLVLPSLFHADLLSHVGGFVSGAILAWRIAPLEDRFRDGGAS